MNTLFQWFAQSGQAAFVTAVLSVVALVVAASSWHKSHRVQERLLEIEEARERERLLSSRQARLTGQLIREPTPGSPRYSLEIRNHGPAEAREVCLSIDGERVANRPTELGPGSFFPHLLAVTSGKASQIHKLQITWSDDSGQPGSYQTDFAI